MQIEQAIATAIFAMQDPAAMATKPEANDLIAFQTDFSREATPKGVGFNLRGRSLNFSAKGRYRNADSRALLQYTKECENLAKVYPGYPQPAFVTFRVHVSL